MRNSFGNNLKITLFGESHGEQIGAVLDGVPAGIAVDMDYINEKMNLRKATQPWSTQRQEPDAFRIVSGVFEGKTTGTPITFLIENKDVVSSDYEAFKDCPRPGHGDYASYVKHHGNNDYRGGGHGSGRITAALVAAGAMLQGVLEKKGIYIGTHIAECGMIEEKAFSKDRNTLLNEIEKVNQSLFPVLDSELGKMMIDYIYTAKEEKDSVGGVLETAVVGLEAGVGEPWFDSLEGMLAHGIFSIPGVKGVSFGRGFEFASVAGSEGNDVFYMEGDKVATKTNNNGGINGGISNGMPVLINTAFKPTPTIGVAQQTVDLKTGELVMLEGKGRHDPAIFTRGRVVVDSVTAFVIADMLCCRFGTEYLLDQ